MEYYRTIMEVKVICAKELKNVNMFTKMDVYVMGSISSDPNTVQKSPVHKKGGSDPVWNHRFKFHLKESEIKLNRSGLVFCVVSNRTLGDREIGRVYVPMKELYDNVITGKENSGEIPGEVRFMTYRVQTMSGKFKGSLEFSYKFGEKITKIVDRKVNKPVMAYPVFHGSGLGQGSYPVQGPPPAEGNAYEYQSQQQVLRPVYGETGNGLGYSGQSNSRRSNGVGTGNGLGYSGQANLRRSNGVGTGAALGVVAGLLGGFMLGEMVEDIVDAGGCDGGYMNDGGDMMNDGCCDGGDMMNDGCYMDGGGSDW